MGTCSSNDTCGFVCQLQVDEGLQLICPSNDGAKLTIPEQVVSNAVALGKHAVAREIVSNVQSINSANFRRVFKVKHLPHEKLIKKPDAPRY